MSRKGLIGMLVAGAVALSGAVCALREKPLENGWKRCELYAQSPQYPEILQKNIFDKIYVGIDDTMRHPESNRVSCSDWHYATEETLHNSCFTGLVSNEDEKGGLIATVSEERISPDTYKFSELTISGFENNPKRLREIINNSPWIFEASENGGYNVKNVRDDTGRIIERVYTLANGKEIIAKDINKDGILDRYKKIQTQHYSK